MAAGQPIRGENAPEPIPGADAVERIHHTFRFADCRPDPLDLCRAVGYPPGEAPEVALDAIRGLFDRGEALWSLEGGAVVLPGLAVDRAAGRLTVGGRPFEVGKIVAGQLSRATHVAVFLCTAGPRIQELYEGVMREGDPFTSLLGSWLGSLTVELAMDRLQEAVRQAAAARGWKITNRYSPGYCGWHVSEQHELFRLLPPGLAPVRLTESALMQPIKSVSGFIGLGPRVVFNDYTCNLCDHSACIYRDAKAHRAERADG